MGRSSEIVNVPTKPTPEGFKIWILANSGYVLDWMWHAKGSGKSEGPYDLDETWTKEEGFSRTQAVVLDLVMQEGISNEHCHIIWLDNLFTSHRLLIRLRELGFGTAGTVRTSKTAQEEKEESHGTKAQKKEKELYRGMAESLVNLKQWEKELEWGKLFVKVTPDKKAIQFIWKDARVVMFMSTVAEPKATVTRSRRRPAKTGTNAKTSRAPFSDSSTQDLPIPAFIDFYNHFMNGVDVADQLRSYYDTQRIHVKNWKALWHFLLDVAIVNAYKIVCGHQDDGPKVRRDSGHMRFRSQLAMTLFEHCIRRKGKPLRKSTSLYCLVDTAPVEAHEWAEKLPSNTPRTCEACKMRGVVNSDHTKKRKPLQELNPNSLVGKKRRNRTPRSRGGCSLCKISLCKRPECWQDHLDAAKLRNAA